MLTPKLPELSFPCLSPLLRGEENELNDHQPTLINYKAKSFAIYFPNQWLNALDVFSEGKVFQAAWLAYADFLGYDLDYDSQANDYKTAHHVFYGMLMDHTDRIFFPDGWLVSIKALYLMYAAYEDVLKTDPTEALHDFEEQQLLVKVHGMLCYFPQLAMIQQYAVSKTSQDDKHRSETFDKQVDIDAMVDELKDGKPKYENRLAAMKSWYNFIAGRPWFGFVKVEEVFPDQPGVYPKLESFRKQYPEHVIFQADGYPLARVSQETYAEWVATEAYKPRQLQ